MSNVWFFCKEEKKEFIHKIFSEAKLELRCLFILLQEDSLAQATVDNNLTIYNQHFRRTLWWCHHKPQWIFRVSYKGADADPLNSRETAAALPVEQRLQQDARSSALAHLDPRVHLLLLVVGLLVLLRAGLSLQLLHAEDQGEEEGCHSRTKRRWLPPQAARGLRSDC